MYGLERFLAKRAFMMPRKQAEMIVRSLRLSSSVYLGLSAAGSQPHGAAMISDPSARSPVHYPLPNLTSSRETLRTETGEYISKTMAPKMEHCPLCFGTSRGQQQSSELLLGCAFLALSSSALYG